MTQTREIDPALAVRLREAEEVGCSGLVNGTAKSLLTREDCFAETTWKREGPFYCPKCFSDVVVRKCSEKTDHFAHKSRLSPVLGAGESDKHRECKEELRAHLAERYPEGNWATERTIPASTKRKTPELRPDVSGRIEGHRVVIEVQASSLTIPKIVARTVNYAKCGVAILWVVPLTGPLSSLPFRPRLYERYLHSIYFGRTYYWRAGKGLNLSPVHYGPATRYIAESEWHEDGQLQTAGGFEKTYLTIKTPEFGEDVDICSDFMREGRTAHTPENERKEVPACSIWRDKLSPWW